MGFTNGFSRPRGRERKDCYWDKIIGMWVHKTTGVQYQAYGEVHQIIVETGDDSSSSTSSCTSSCTSDYTSSCASADSSTKQKKKAKTKGAINIKVAPTFTGFLFIDPDVTVNFL